MATPQQIEEWRAQDAALRETVIEADEFYDKRKRQLGGLAERGEGGEKQNARMLLMDARLDLLEAMVEWLVLRETIRQETGQIAP